MIMREVEDPPYIKNAKPGKIDGIGLGLLAVWLGCLQIILDKGQEDDWFGATWIRYATLLLVVCFVLFIVRQFLHEHPLVNLRVFRHRNFTLGCILIGIFGAAIYGLITLLPLLYQELLGYNAVSAGLAVSPRGLGAIVAMPIIGVLDGEDRQPLADCAWLRVVRDQQPVVWEGESWDLAVVVYLGNHDQRLWQRMHFRAAVDDRHGGDSE